MILWRPVKARQSYGIFARFRAAVCKEEGIDVAGVIPLARSQTGTRLCRHEWIGVRAFAPVHVSPDDPFIAVSYIDGHQLAVEIDETLSSESKINTLARATGIGSTLTEPPFK
jgi:hypothetical protein